jgi:hypothetical protein
MVNMLVDHGHPDAWTYPLGRVSDEVALVVERLNGLAVTNALGFRAAYVSAKVERGDEVMKNFIESLNGE